jgi:hypothetical protein
MESSTVQLLLSELETARGSLDRAFACFVPGPKTLNKEAWILSDPAPGTATIKVVTENGFVIERFCEREASKTDSASGCHFIVRGPNDEERHVTVVFSEDPVGVIRSMQRSNRLSLDSHFWLECAESQLADYLWTKNDYPPGELLIIFDLLDQNLRLAMQARNEIFPSR